MPDQKTNKYGNWRNFKLKLQRTIKAYYQTQKQDQKQDQNDATAVSNLLKAFYSKVDSEQYDRADANWEKLKADIADDIFGLENSEFPDFLVSAWQKLHMPGTLDKTTANQLMLEALGSELEIPESSENYWIYLLKIRVQLRILGTSVPFGGCLESLANKHGDSAAELISFLRHNGIDNAGFVNDIEKGLLRSRISLCLAKSVKRQSIIRQILHFITNYFGRYTGLWRHLLECSDSVLDTSLKDIINLKIILISSDPADQPLLDHWLNLFNINEVDSDGFQLDLAAGCEHSNIFHSLSDSADLSDISFALRNCAQRIRDVKSAWSEIVVFQRRLQANMQAKSTGNNKKLAKIYDGVISFQDEKRSTMTKLSAFLKKQNYDEDAFIEDVELGIDSSSIFDQLLYCSEAAQITRHFSTLNAALLNFSPPQRIIENQLAKYDISLVEISNRINLAINAQNIDMEEVEKRLGKANNISESKYDEDDAAALPPLKLSYKWWQRKIKGKRGEDIKKLKICAAQADEKSDMAGLNMENEQHKAVAGQVLDELSDYVCALVGRKQKANLMTNLDLEDLQRRLTDFKMYLLADNISEDQGSTEFLYAWLATVLILPDMDTNMAQRFLLQFPDALSASGGQNWVCLPGSRSRLTAARSLSGFFLGTLISYSYSCLKNSERIAPRINIYKGNEAHAIAFLNWALGVPVEGLNDIFHELPGTDMTSDQLRQAMEGANIAFFRDAIISEIVGVINAIKNNVASYGVSNLTLKPLDENSTLIRMLGVSTEQNYIKSSSAIGTNCYIDFEKLYNNIFKGLLKTKVFLPKDISKGKKVKEDKNDLAAFIRNPLNQSKWTPRQTLTQQALFSQIAAKRDQYPLMLIPSLPFLNSIDMKSAAKNPDALPMQLHQQIKALPQAEDQLPCSDDQRDTMAKKIAIWLEQFLGDKQTYNGKAWEVVTGANPNLEGSEEIANVFAVLIHQGASGKIIAKYYLDYKVKTRMNLILNADFSNLLYHPDGVAILELYADYFTLSGMYRNHECFFISPNAQANFIAQFTLAAYLYRQPRDRQSEKGGRDGNEEKSNSDDSRPISIYAYMQARLETILNIPACQALLNQPVTSNGRAALVLACKFNIPWLVKYLVVRKANMHQLYGNDCSPFWICCKNGRAEALKVLLQYTKDVNRTDTQTPPLFAACSEGHDRIVKLLLAHGADITQSYKNVTPLYIACERGHNKVVSLLLENKANVEKRCNYKKPLWIACRNGHSSIVELLLENNPPAKIQIFLGLISLAYITVEQNHDKVLKILIKHGVRLSYRPPTAGIVDFATPLELACENGNAKIVKLLLDQNMNPNCMWSRTNQISLLQRACINGYCDVVELLISYGATHEKEAKGSSCLELAIQSGHLNVVRSLLTAGVKISKSIDNLLKDPEACLTKRKWRGYRSAQEAIIRFSEIYIKLNTFCERLMTITKYSSESRVHFQKQQKNKSKGGAPLPSDSTQKEIHDQFNRYSDLTTEIIEGYIGDQQDLMMLPAIIRNRSKSLSSLDRQRLKQYLRIQLQAKMTPQQQKLWWST